MCCSEYRAVGQTQRGSYATRQKLGCGRFAKANKATIRGKKVRQPEMDRHKRMKKVERQAEREKSGTVADRLRWKDRERCNCFSMVALPAEPTSFKKKLRSYFLLFWVFISLHPAWHLLCPPSTLFPAVPFLQHLSTPAAVLSYWILKTLLQVPKCERVRTSKRALAQKSVAE